MSRVTPRRVVDTIDATFTWARRPGAGEPLHAVSAPDLAMVVALCRELPREVLPTDPDDYSGFVAAVAAIHGALERWSGMPTTQADATPLQPMRAFDGRSAISTLREILARCPEEGVLPKVAGLEFVKDAGLRESLRLDLSRARRAVEHEDFKSAAVLSGSVIEALLLDALENIDRARLDVAHARWVDESRRPGDPLPGKKLNPSIDRWSLHELVSVAVSAGLISRDAGNAADVARDFRNLIHPGKERTRAPADEGTAYAALGAALRVASELSQRALAQHSAGTSST